MGGDAGSTSASQTCGSTSFILQLTIRLYLAAAFEWTSIRYRTSFRF